MQHQDLSLASIAASARRILLATVAVLAAGVVLGAITYAVGRWL